MQASEFTCVDVTMPRDASGSYAPYPGDAVAAKTWRPFQDGFPPEASER